MKRPDQSKLSNKRTYLRLTEEELDSAAALAEYLKISVSDVYRQAVEVWRKQMLEQGLKPPRKPRNHAG